MHIGESTTCRISEEKLLDLEIGHFEAAGGRFFPAQCLTHDQSRNFLLDIWVGGDLPCWYVCHHQSPILSSGWRRHAWVACLRLGCTL